MKKCPFCFIIYKGPTHISACGRKHGFDKNTSKFKCLELNFPEISNKNVLINEYLIQLKSLTDIRYTYGIDFKSTIFLLDYYNIKRRNISEGQKLSGIPKIESTCMKKYGTTNVFSKGSPIYENRNKNVFNKYGVKNVRQLNSVKLKINTAMIQKYGKLRISNPLKLSEIQKSFSIEKRNSITNKMVETKNNWSNEKKLAYKVLRGEITKNWYASLNDEEKTKHFKKVFSKFSHFASNLETRIQKILNAWSIEYTSQKYISKFVYDICISNKLIIEINGDYWHANPEIYSENDIISYPNNNKIKAKDVWERDLIKRSEANLKGYDVLYIWEKDMSIMNDEMLENYLYNKIEEYLNAINSN